MNPKFLLRLLKASAFFCAPAFILSFTAQSQDALSKTSPVLTGQAAFTDAAHESPGIRRHLTAADLPAPAPEQSVDNGATLVPRQTSNWPIAPKGFKVSSMPQGSTTLVCCARRQTAISSWPRAPVAKSRSSAE